MYCTKTVIVIIIFIILFLYQIGNYFNFEKFNS